MRTRIDFIARRVPVATSLIGCDVELVWQQPVNGQPMVREAVDGVPTVPMERRSETVKALLYFVSATTQIRHFAEIQAGDCIATFSPDVNLQGRESLRFLIDGDEWSSKPVSEQLAGYWGRAANLKLYLVVLLRKGT